MSHGSHKPRRLRYSSRNPGYELARECNRKLASSDLHPYAAFRRCSHGSDGR
jgi:hypothetical protein